jgi:hypothetical protein
MRQTLRWIIAASLLVEVAKCDSILAIPFYASRYTDQSNLFRLQFSTRAAPQAVLWTSVFANNPYGPPGYGRQVISSKILLLLPLPEHSASYWIGGQPDNGVNATLWKWFKVLIGANSGPCERAWTRDCEHSFANPAYRPSPRKK